LVDGLRARRAGDGRRFRILAVIDDYTRENRCLVAHTSLPGGCVIRSSRPNEIEAK
jgi:hypothetical protein